MTLWIVDDNQADIYLISQALSEAGLEFTCEPMLNEDALLASIGAVTKNEVELPNAIILDLHLVKYRGTELLTLIRSEEAIANVPIIILTASRSPEDRVQAEKLGAAAYFQKTLDLESLMLVGRKIVAFLTKHKFKSTSKRRKNWHK